MMNYDGGEGREKKRRVRDNNNKRLFIMVMIVLFCIYFISVLLMKLFGVTVG